jgi:hypothetical protein
VTGLANACPVSATPDVSVTLLYHILQATVKTNKFDHGAILLSSLVFELQKSSSPGLDPRTLFQSSHL